nr:hypothetical protein GCM10020093_002840 [Planobispora longispora]
MRRRLGWSFWLALGWITLILAAAATADLLPLPRYDETLVGPPQAAPARTTRSAPTASAGTC